MALVQFSLKSTSYSTKELKNDRDKKYLYGLKLYDVLPA